MAFNITDYFPIEEEDEDAEAIPINPEIGGEYDPLESVGLAPPRAQAADPEIKEAPPPQGAELPRAPTPRAVPSGQSLPTSKAPPPMAANPMRVEDSGSPALAQLAQSRSQAPAQQQQAFVPPPPQLQRRESDNTEGYIALLADFLLSKGKHAGQLIAGMSQGDERDIDFENWKRNASAAEMNSQIAARNKPAGVSYTQLAAKDRMEHAAQMRAPDSEISKNVAAEYARQLDRDPATMVGKVSAEQIMMMKSGFINEMTGDRTRQGRSETNEEYDRRMGLRGREHDRQFAMSQDAQLSKEQRELGYDVAKEERGAARTADIRGQDFQKDFQKTHANDLDIAGLVQDIESTPGGAAPQGFAERFRSSILAHGIDPARLEAWQAKQMILELWSREQSGAAISGTEDGKFITQVGMNPDASKEQVEAAYANLGRVISRRLRGGSAPNKEAARALALEYGLDADRWIGATPQAVRAPASAPRPRKPAAGGGVPRVVTDADLEGF